MTIRSSVFLLLLFVSSVTAESPTQPTRFTPRDAEQESTTNAQSRQTAPAAPLVAKKSLPLQPAPHAFIQDYARVITSADRIAIKKLQANSYGVQDTPILVVTIRSKADWGRKGQDISNVAQQLFDHWQIGKRKNGRLINRGVLVLVSMMDRQARIELGADWGHAWDDHCDEIMQETIVPACKRGNVSAGLVDAVERLAEMSKEGPDGNVPFSFFSAIKKPMVKGFNTLPRWIGFLCMSLGAAVMVAAFAFPKLNLTSSTGSLPLSLPMFYVGAGIFIFGVLYKAIVILLAIALWMMGIGRRQGSSSDWGGGGFGSGGFSGGGGASGEW